MWQDQFPKKDWTEFLLHHGSPLDLQLKEVIPFIKKLVDDCQFFIETNQFAKVIDRIMLGLLISKEDFLKRFKKKGWLRYSHYKKEKNPIRKIATHLLQYRELIGLSVEDIYYFESLLRLEPLAKEMKVALLLIQRTILKHKNRPTKIISGKVTRPNIIKSLLAINDYAFLNRVREDQIEVDPESPIIEQYTIEERSDAISLLVSLAEDHIGIRSSDFLFIDEAFAISEECKHLITSACRYKAFKEIEIAIEALGFICVENDGQFEIIYPNEQTHKSMELSHIMGNLQKHADHITIDYHYSELLTLKDLAAELHKKYPDMVQFVREPYPRFRMEIPGAVLIAVSKQPISAFREEYDALEYIQNEMSLSLEDLEKYQLIDGLSLHEFMIINRAFSVLQILYSENLKELVTDDNYLFVLNSILALYSKKEIIELFKHILPEEKILKWLSIVSWHAAEDKFLDLQYTPIVTQGDLYLISLSVLKHSRKERNAIASLARNNNNLKAAQMHLLESVPRQLNEAFTKQQFKCFEELKIYYTGKHQTEGDIDFLAYRDGHIFICECKDVLDSVDSFEYRRINDYLTKAASQLDYIRSAVTDPVYAKALSDRTGIDFLSVKGLHFIITPTARKMYGYEMKGYPVRNMHELTNFVETGNWNLKPPEKDHMHFQLWQTPEFSVNDLLNFISNKGPHSVLFKSMFKCKIPLGRNFHEIKYALVPDELFKNMESAYKYTTTKEFAGYEKDEE